MPDASDAPDARRSAEHAAAPESRAQRGRPAADRAGSGSVAERSGARHAGEDRVSDPERLRRRALFLRELSEAKALRDRVQPRRARAARMREQMRMRTFRW
ncbi:hypothetical protein [Streptomyces chumphonensis]|uniref:hypothetical protein n=1 Tax=Streptomyces chumphonensis TaxID=1214925 RepID=UPI003D7043FE